MKATFKLALAMVGAALLLAGCAGPRYADVSSRIPELESGQGRIYFYQLASTNTDAAQPAILVDGRKVGRSRPGRFFFVDRPAGSHVLTIAPDRKDPGAAIKPDLASGQTVYVRVEVDGGKQVLREEASADTATQSMSNLKYWGAGWRDREKLRY